jgi:hypothetical protein
MWRTLLTRRAGAGGTKRLLREYGARLLCVRYRYDREIGERIKTVELIVDRVRVGGSAGHPDEIVEVKLRRGEDLLRRAFLHAGGKYDVSRAVWRVTRGTATSLGLTARISRSKARS